MAQNKERLKAIFSEVFHNVPSTVTRAKVSGKRKRKMQIAIAFSKARRAGVPVPAKS